MNDANKGSKLYLYSITTVAILGGLLFGYDTAVITGGGKRLDSFFLIGKYFPNYKGMPVITSFHGILRYVIGSGIFRIFPFHPGRRNKS